MIFCFKWLAITFSHAYCTFGFAYVKGVQVIFDIHCIVAVWFLVRGYSHPTHHTGKCGSFWQNLTNASKFWSLVHACSRCWNIPLFCIPTCTGIYIPLTVTPLGDNDHTQACAHLPSAWICLSKKTSHVCSCHTFQQDCQIGIFWSSVDFRKYIWQMLLVWPYFSIFLTIFSLSAIFYLLLSSE